MGFILPIWNASPRTKLGMDCWLKAATNLPLIVPPVPVGTAPSARDNCESGWCSAREIALPLDMSAARRGAQPSAASSAAKCCLPIDPRSIGSRSERRVAAANNAERAARQTRSTTGSLGTLT